MIADHFSDGKLSSSAIFLCLILILYIGQRLTAIAAKMGGCDSGLAGGADDQGEHRLRLALLRGSASLGLGLKVRLQLRLRLGCPGRFGSAGGLSRSRLGSPLRVFD